ncbi:L,D-transpeptidase [Magnetofaba australis]|uniref:Putative ErfK/YbiS/YcfS/YnhG family protein n=1 Tax=Magnetofaba australis IT-1 TaxID=1434232 RepID=A0A1Y2JYQ1_9PROT|nr:L,D-transpeptidase [Magnetofaba australis]OSM00019.1 putative ErfK/YbiS/YcfS/YnhG family protein [Magnetofaba australis IT-1]
MTDQDHLTTAYATLTSSGWSGPGPALVVLGASQMLYALHPNGRVRGRFVISTAANGFGCRENSYQTPTGLHSVSDMIGAGEPLGRLFRGRQPLPVRVLESEDETQDYITTRILRLRGAEPGVNQGPGVDSFERYIYIHGTPYLERLGIPASHGCIRMRGQHILTLFDWLKSPGAPVLILP